VINYHISPLGESFEFDFPSIYQEQLDSRSSAQGAIVRSKIAYIVSRNFVLHTRACAFCFISMTNCYDRMSYSGVSKLGRRQGARIDLLNQC